MPNLKSNKIYYGKTTAERYDRAAILPNEVGDILMERLDCIKVKPRVILDLGCNTGLFTQLLAERYTDSTIIALDILEPMIAATKQRTLALEHVTPLRADMHKLPFADHSIDLIFSNLVLPWTMTLPELLAEIHRVLTPSGVFLFATYGADTLHELRSSWAATDEFAHVNEFIDMIKLGDLLLAEQFSDPVVDREFLALTYHSVPELMQQLKDLGANQIFINKRKTLTGKLRFATMKQHYEAYRHANGLLLATFEIIFGQAIGAEKPPAKDDSGMVYIPVEKIGGRGRGPTSQA